MQQPNPILFVKGKWQSKKVSESERLMSENLKVELAELNFQTESIRLNYQIPEHLMDICKKIVMEVIANVKNATATSEDFPAEKLGVIRVVSESSDIPLAKLV